jgi:hypothetical protein
MPSRRLSFQRPWTPGLGIGWFVALAIAAALSSAAGVRAAQTAGDDSGAKSWVGREGELEAYLRTGRIARTERTKRGVTAPLRAFFEPGGPLASMTWKAIPPGRRGGYFESYKSEIAAYEIDKLLELDMVPPKVERTVENKVGVAVMWVDHAKTFADLGGVPKPPPAKAASWSRELVRAKMFHNLIGDLDPNLGNWLVDSAWQVILIDHSRALTPTKKLVHEMQHIDQPLWERMSALTEAALAPTVSQWLGQDEIRALFDRRSLMQEEIDRLVRSKGEAQVFVR